MTSFAVIVFIAVCFNGILLFQIGTALLERHRARREERIADLWERVRRRLDEAQ